MWSGSAPWALIAQLCIEAGVLTVGREVTLELAEQAQAKIGHFLTCKVEKGQLERADGTRQPDAR